LIFSNVTRAITILKLEGEVASLSKNLQGEEDNRENWGDESE
jgi:hypothetical protein